MSDLTCTGCLETKDSEGFGIKRGKKNTRCKACVNRYYKDIYYANPDRKRYIRERNAENAARAKEESIAIVLSYFSSGCVDCGTKDPRTLEFDHLGDKEFNISVLIGRNSKKKLISEIEKCEVVCANCHRIRTYSRMDSWRNAAVYPLADNE